MTETVQPTTLVMELDKPITFNGGTYSTLTLCEPTSGAVKKAQGHLRNGVHPESMTLYQMVLVSVVSGWPLQAIELLPISVMEEAAGFVLGFTNRSQRTGEI